MPLRILEIRISGFGYFSLSRFITSNFIDHAPQARAKTVKEGIES
jgi:hypothetical protein